MRNLRSYKSSITVYIYTFWSYDSHCDRAIKYLNFETNVDVYSCLTPVLPPLMSACVRFFLKPSSQSCGRLLWMTPKLNRLHKILFKLRQWQKTDHCWISLKCYFLINFITLSLRILFSTSNQICSNISNAVGIFPKSYLWRKLFAKALSYVYVATNDNLL